MLNQRQSVATVISAFPSSEHTTLHSLGWTQKQREPFANHQLSLTIAHLTVPILTSLVNRVLEIFSKRKHRIRKTRMPQWRQTATTFSALHYKWRSMYCCAHLIHSYIDLYMTDGSKLMIGTHSVSVSLKLWFLNCTNQL